MGHNPRNGDQPLAAVRRFQAPNLLVLTRSERPPFPSLLPVIEQEKAPRDVEPSTKGTKSEIRGKSEKSSLNLARVLSSLDWKKHGRCLHVSLTYWKHWPSSKEELAAEKSALVARLGEQCECGIWSLEYQARLVPHWHCLVWIGDSDAEIFEVWVRKWWAKFSGNPSEHGVKITSGDQARGTWYLAMHAAKRSQSPPFAVGRWWGYINREALLGAQDIHETGVCDERERVWLARIYRRSTGCKVRHMQGFSWFLPAGYQWELLAWIRDKIEDERRSRAIGGKPPF